MLQLKFDIVCIIICLLLIIPTIIYPQLYNSQFYVLNIILIILGIISIIYGTTKNNHHIVQNKHIYKYQYFGNIMLTAGTINIMYVLTKPTYNIGS